MRHLYSTVLYIIAPVILLRLLWRSRLNPAYRTRIGERFAHIQSLPNRPRIWIHAVSVGEMIAIAPLIRELQQAYPDHAFLVTTTTPTGSAQVRRLFGHTVEHCYLPYDLPHVVGRFFSRVRPQLALLMETELWPNLFHACHVRAIPLMVVNARLSERSLRGYLRANRLLRETLACVRLIAAQDPESARRFEKLGGRDVRVLGNLKYDLDVPSEALHTGRALREHFGNTRPVWVAASTHADETESVLSAYREVKKRIPDMLLILVPRHPEYFEEAYKACIHSGYQVARRSLGECGDAMTDVLLGDTLGELLSLYAAADLAFLGGSLVPSGGHNPLEAAALGLPVLTGPHVSNFHAVYQALIEAGAAQVIENHENLGAKVVDLMSDSLHRNEAGSAGKTVVLKNQGALLRTVQVIREVLLQADSGGASSV